jgi:uncharacterized membrane protein HdeD (DUF308 family)
VSSLLVALTIFATAVVSVAFGIFAAYGTVLFILHAFNQRRELAPVALVASASHASGD